MSQILNPRRVKGWQKAEDRIGEIVNALCDGKSPRERAAVAAELVSIVKVVADGHHPDDLREDFEVRVRRFGWRRALWQDNHILGGRVTNWRIFGIIASAVLWPLSG
jgi:plasmid stabilization system protein ParE